MRAWRGQYFSCLGYETRSLFSRQGLNAKGYFPVLQKQGVNSSKIENHISDLKQQKITQIIFLPANSQM